VLGLLELGLGRPAAAIEALEPLVELTEEHGLEEPGVVWWTADLVEAYIQADRRHDAERLLERLERQAANTGRTWALATAARCRGLLADKQDFARHFAEALRWHARKPTPFERARTDLRFGQRLRRTKQPSRARGPLRAAHEMFHRLGARPWEEVAAGELRSIGERVEPGPPGGLGQLTPRELQIALAVARGATNREAAASLFLSPKTVEYHLGKTYAKLGVRSRTELAVLVESAARTGTASAGT
jgi:DNA-binding CsgD family transcriptional regulator